MFRVEENYNLSCLSASLFGNWSSKFEEIGCHQHKDCKFPVMTNFTVGTQSNKNQTADIYTWFYQKLNLCS